MCTCAVFVSRHDRIGISLLQLRKPRQLTQMTTEAFAVVELGSKRRRHHGNFDRLHCQPYHALNISKDTDLMQSGAQGQ